MTQGGALGGDVTPAAVTIRAVLVGRNRLVGASALAGAVTVATAGVVGVVSPATAPDLALAVVAFGWPFVLGLAGAWAAYWRPSRREVSLRVTDGALSLDRAEVRSARSLSAGEATVITGERIRVDLRSRYRQRVRLEVAKAASARTMLAALGLDRRAGTSKFRVRRLREYAGLLFLAGFLSFPASILLAALSGWLGAVAFLLVVTASVLDWLRTGVELTIGNDGLDLRSPFGRTFVPHGRIRSIQPIVPGAHQASSTRSRDGAYGFDIELDDGAVHRIDTRTERAGAESSATDPSFEAALAAWSGWKNAAAGPGMAASALLARGERSARDWLAGLRGLAVDGGSGYRVAAVDGHALFALLVDATATRELRAAAAVVLGAKEEHAARLRVVADDVADPLVRRIAVASLDGDDAAALAEELDEACPPRSLGARAIEPPAR